MAKKTKAYGLNNPLQDVFPEPVKSQRAPAANDKRYELGQVWIDIPNDRIYALTSVVASAATWSLLGPGASDVDTLTGDTGGALSPAAGNINILGGDGLTVAGAGSTLTINRDSDGGYPLTSYLIGPSGEAGYQTIQAGIDAANASGSDATIYIQPGAYTENLTLYDGIDLVGSIYTGVTITGTHTPPTSGRVQFQDITLVSATDIFNSAAAGTTDISVIDCEVNVTNGYLFDLLNWTGTLEIGETGTVGTNDGFVNNTGGSTIICNASEAGIGTGNSAVISGTAILFNSYFVCPVDFQTGSDINADDIKFFNTVTLSNNSTGYFKNCNFDTGATAAIDHGSSAVISVSTTNINSSNIPAIDGAGAGTLTLTGVDFLDDATTAGTLTLAYGQTTTGRLLATGAHHLDSGAGADITINMGDNAGANKVSFTDSDDAEVFAIDSNGGIGTLAGLTVAGAFAQTAGTFNVGQDNAANAINIGGGTTARAIGIANSAAAHTTTIGTVTGASSLDLLAGTGNFTIEGNVATTYAISNTGVNTGQVDIAGGTGARTINIGAGGTGAKTINIGAAASADLITVGDATGAGSLDLACGTGNFTLEGNVASTYDISGTGVNTGTITIGGGTGAQTLAMMNVAGVKTVNLANGVDGNTVSILNGINTGAQTINIAGGANAANSTVNVMSGIATAGTQTLNLATGASASAVNIGNATGATAVAITSGTGSLALASTGAGDITIDSDDTLLLDADGVLELNSSAGIIGIGNDADAFAINIGTGAAARTITLGNVTGASATVIQSGTGDITMTGTVKEVTSEFITRSGDYITFSQSPIGQSNLDTGVAPTGTNGDVNLLSFQEGMLMEQFMIGTQTIIVPRMDATGLLSSLDLTATDGWELNFGAARANSRHSYTIGTDLAFFMELRFTLADVSGCEPLYFGFRKTQANQAAFGAYTDFVGYGVNNLVAGGDAVIGTQLNTGGINSTDTNDAWGDGTTHTLQVLVSAAGVVTFTFDGGAPTATQAYTFDNGDVVHPFICNLMGAAAPGAIHLQWIKVGYQA